MTGPNVRDSAGRKYILEKESAESSQVRNPITGERTNLPNEELERIDGSSPLEIAAESLPSEAVDLVASVPSERALGILVTLDARGPTRVRTLLDSTTLCESDLHGLLASLTAANLVETETVAGERGYAVTESTQKALEQMDSPE